MSFEVQNKESSLLKFNIAIKLTLDVLEALTKCQGSSSSAPAILSSTVTYSYLNLEPETGEAPGGVAAAGLSGESKNFRKNVECSFKTTAKDVSLIQP